MGQDVEVERRAEMFALEAKINQVDHNQKSHDKICAERYLNIHTGLDDLKDTIKLIFNRAWKISGILILILLGIIGTLYVEKEELQHQGQTHEEH